MVKFISFDKQKNLQGINGEMATTLSIFSIKNHKKKTEDSQIMRRW